LHQRLQQQRKAVVVINYFSLSLLLPPLFFHEIQH
jgi:hypothetical protein